MSLVFTPLESPTHNQAVSYDRGTKRTVAMGAGRLRLQPSDSVLCLMRIAYARFLKDNTFSDGDVKVRLSVTPSDSVLCLVRIAHARFLSRQNSLSEGDVKVCQS